MRVMIRRMAEGKITFQETSKMAIITLRRPERRNALTAGMWHELAQIGKMIEKNHKNKVVILKGCAGHFTAGSDIEELYHMPEEQANAAFQQMEDAISTFENLSLPVIGVIDGAAMGAGFILSLACDLRIGTEHTKMGIPVGRLGITLGPSFVRRIVRLIGPSRTKELVYTNKIYNVQEAEQLGLLNTVVGSKELNHVCLQLARTISNQSMASLKAVKRSVQLSLCKEDIAWKHIDPVDFHEGCLAFMEKRTPKFQ